MSANDRQCGPPSERHGSRFLRLGAAVDGRCIARPLAALRVARARRRHAHDLASLAGRTSHDRAVEPFERGASSGRALVAKAAGGVTLAAGQTAEPGQARLSLRAARVADGFALTRRHAHRAAIANHADPIERASLFGTISALIRFAHAAGAAIGVSGAARRARIAVVGELQLAAFAPRQDLAATGVGRTFQALDAGLARLALRQSRHAGPLIPGRTRITRRFAATARRGLRARADRIPGGAHFAGAGAGFLEQCVFSHTRDRKRAHAGQQPAGPNPRKRGKSESHCQ